MSGFGGGGRGATLTSLPHRYPINRPKHGGNFDGDDEFTYALLPYVKQALRAAGELQGESS